MTKYTAESIEVLSGLEPVKKRPGMYTDTTRPNHLAQEVIDNSVDEALAGFATKISVTYHKDGSISCEDDGRGMPTDKHPKEKVPGVEVILTRLHAGAKFSNKNYKFSGGLHGVGVSVVNALSEKLTVTIFQNTKSYEMSFKDGKRSSPLKVTGEVAKRKTGTIVRFWPREKYFDTLKISTQKLMALLKAKAVLCPGLEINFYEEATKNKTTWFYEDGITEYLTEQLTGIEYLPELPFVDEMQGDTESVTWALVWVKDNEPGPAESFVNLIPTLQGGTHANGLRQGLLDALREFCELRNLLPKGLKLAPDDIWLSCRYVLSVKMQDPQFAGQTKERLSSRQTHAFVSGVVKDAFNLWLNQHIHQAEEIANLIINKALLRTRAQSKVARKKLVSGPQLPGKLADCSSQNLQQAELFLVEGDSAGGSAKQARDRSFQAIMPLRGKILNSWEIDPMQILKSQEVHDITVAIGVDPGSDDLSKLRYGKICILADADSDGLHIATLLCALFVKHFSTLVKNGHIYVAMPPLFRIDVGKQVFYALDEDEKKGILDRIIAEKLKGTVNVQRFKGLGEMNPMQLRETTMAPETRRLVQLTLDETQSWQTLDMLLAKKRSSDRKNWLETKGNLANI